MATIQDIAEKCDVSSATVSYVLNGRSEEMRISKAKQAQILDTAALLGYKSKRKAKIESDSKRIPSIAIFWRSENYDMVVPSVVKGINRVLATEASKVNVVIRPYEVGHIFDSDIYLYSNQFDAAVLTGLNQADLDYIQRNRPSTPTVLVNRSLSGFSDVSIDSREVGRLAAVHALGVSDDVALVMNPSSLSSMKSQGNAFIQTCRDNGIDISENIYYCDNKIGSAYALAQDLIKRDAIHKGFYCSYDMVALGMINAFMAAGLDVGKEVHVLAASNGPSDLFLYSNPSITVINQKMAEITERSLRMALDIVTNKISDERHQLVYPVISYGKSSPANYHM